MKKLLSTVFIGGLLLLGIACAIDDKNHPWAFATMDGLGTGILISVLLIWLYDESRARKDEQERSSRERRVARRLAAPVRTHYHLLLDCYRSATDKAETPTFDSVNDFIGVGFEVAVKRLDLYAQSPMRTDVVIPYYEYIDLFSKSFRDALRQALDNHAPDIGEEFAAAIEAVLQSNFLRLACELSRICPFTPPGFPPRMMSLDGGGSMVGDYGVAFCRLLNAMEEVERQGLRQFKPESWHNAIFAPGHARKPEPGQPTHAAKAG